MFNHVLKLIPKIESVSNLGVTFEAEGTPRLVFCNVQSVTMAENFQGVTAGFKPVLRAALADRLDYRGEKLCEYEGVRYEIYRTYWSGTTHGLELYLQERAGVTGG